MATDFIIVSANVENNIIIAFPRQRKEILCIILYPIQVPKGKVEAPDGRFPDGRFPATKNS